MEKSKVAGNSVAGIAALGMAIMTLATSCGEHEKPNFTYMPDMAYGPGYKAQEAQVDLAEPAMRTPVPGTVARNSEYYPLKPDQQDAAARQFTNPLKISKQVLERGRDRYNIYCVVCHGTYGEGDGPVVPAFPAPPTLQSDKIKGWLKSHEDGRVFHIMTVGQNRMPSYAYQIQDPNDRWAIIHYIRALHRAKNPSEEDLKKLENW